MKKYKLKQWYPSLDEKWDTTHRYEYQSSTGYMCNKSIQHCVIIYKKELHSDFWELIEEEKPLFVTEDGVYIYKDEWEMFAVEKRTFRKTNILSSNLMRHLYLLFNEEANADEYIWRNKRVFSYEEIAKRASQTELYYLETLAMERSKE